MPNLAIIILSRDVEHYLCSPAVAAINNFLKMAALFFSEESLRNVIINIVRHYSLYAKNAPKKEVS